MIPIKPNHIRRPPFRPTLPPQRPTLPILTPINMPEINPRHLPIAPLKPRLQAPALKRAIPKPLYAAKPRRQHPSRSVRKPARTTHDEKRDLAARDQRPRNALHSVRPGFLQVPRPNNVCGGRGFGEDGAAQRVHATQVVERVRAALVEERGFVAAVRALEEAVVVADHGAPSFLLWE